MVSRRSWSISKTKIMMMFRRCSVAAALLLAGPLLIPLSASAGTVSINSQTAGATPFIKDLNGTVTPAAALKSVQFTISPKTGSVTRPVSAAYSASYLKSRGYLNPQSGALVIPVFGLYPNYTNDVALRFVFTDNTIQQSNALMPTTAWGDACGQFNNPTVIQARSGSTSLSYDYFLIKNNCGSQSPVLMDSDGLVRWVGTAGSTSHASMFFANGIYLSVPPPIRPNRPGWPGWNSTAP